MDEEKRLILESLREILCLIGEPYQNNSFVRERLDNLTIRINQTLNPKEEPSLTDKTKNALSKCDKCLVLHSPQNCPNKQDALRGKRE